MIDRPLSVTIAGCILLIPAGLALVALAHVCLSRHRAELVASWTAQGRLMLAKILAVPVVALLLAWAILSGEQWGRLGLFLWCAFIVVHGFLAKKPKRVILARIALAALFALLLLNGSANE